MTMVTVDGGHMFSGEDTSGKEGSVLMIAKSSYEGATLNTEAVGVVVGI
jgi:hypothetical protein